LGHQDTQRVRECFEHLSRHCHERFGGKVHLTKNLYCSTGLLREMYREQLATFGEIKRTYDAKGLLWNRLCERLLPGRRLAAGNARILVGSDPTIVDG
jgi:hypothetical protein